MENEVINLSHDGFVQAIDQNSGRWFVCANCGYWNGRRRGWVFANGQKLMDVVFHRNYDDVDIVFNTTEKCFQITAVHHDGRDYLTVYRLSSVGERLSEKSGSRLFREFNEYQTIGKRYYKSVKLI